MSVRGEYRRILGDAVVALRGGGPACAGLAGELIGLGERAEGDLAAAAEATLSVLGRLDARAATADGEDRRIAESAEHLEALCRVILGRS